MALLISLVALIVAIVVAVFIVKFIEAKLFPALFVTVEGKAGAVLFFSLLFIAIVGAVFHTSVFK